LNIFGAVWLPFFFSIHHVHADVLLTTDDDDDDGYICTFIYSYLG